MQTLFSSYTLKKASEATKTRTKIICIRIKLHVKKEELRFSFLELSGAVCRFLNPRRLHYEMQKNKKTKELFCIYYKLYSEIGNIKNYEILYDKYVTYSYKGRNGWLEKTWRSVVGKTGMFPVPTNRFNHNGVNFRTRLQLG